MKQQRNIIGLRIIGMKYNIGFIGLGKLGLPVVRVIQQKHKVVSFDIKYNFNSLAQCVIGQDIIFIAVPTPHEEQRDGRYISSCGVGTAIKIISWPITH
jgi:UDP-N-acetyl-D-mannosaminuronate dehydrogenase